MHTELLTAEQLYDADRTTIFHGVAGAELMERAGNAVAGLAIKQFSPRATLILCGSGNNGGDGYIIARLLKAAGWQVTLVALLPDTEMQGDAAAARQAWSDAGGQITDWDAQLLRSHTLIIDALFGIGLTRPITGTLQYTLKTVAKWSADHNIPVIAVDIPSGVHTDSGAVMGIALPAAYTVTFFRPKQGLFLSPGKFYCGTIITADIGIADTVLEELNPQTSLNIPPLWSKHLSQNVMDTLPNAASSEGPMPSHTMALFKERKPCILTPAMMKKERALRAHPLYDGVIMLIEETPTMQVDTEEEGNAIVRARRYARQCGAVVIFGGDDTLIAAPNGRVAVTDDRFPSSANATEAALLPALLTTLLAHHIASFDAACIAVWLHDMVVKQGLDVASDEKARSTGQALIHALRMMQA